MSTTHEIVRHTSGAQYTIDAGAEQTVTLVCDCGWTATVPESHARKAEREHTWSR